MFFLSWNIQLLKGYYREASFERGIFDFDVSLTNVRIILDATLVCVCLSKVSDLIRQWWGTEYTSGSK